MAEHLGRRSIRLKGWDYRERGWYFVTVTTHMRRGLLARVADGRMTATDAGLLVERQWHRIPDRFPFVRIDAFVLMPDHIHGLLEITHGPQAHPDSPDPGPPRGTEPNSFGAIMQGFKSGATRRVRARYPELGAIWHRGYYERILRTDAAVCAVRRYIAENPARWIMARR